MFQYGEVWSHCRTDGHPVKSKNFPSCCVWNINKFKFFNFSQTKLWTHYFLRLFSRRSRSSDKLHAPKFISIHLECFPLPEDKNRVRAWKIRPCGHPVCLKSAHDDKKRRSFALSFSLPEIAQSVPVSTATGYEQHGYSKMFVLWTASRQPNVQRVSRGDKVAGVWGWPLTTDQCNAEVKKKCLHSFMSPWRSA
jgi:hypothetical protein